MWKPAIIAFATVWLTTASAHAGLEVYDANSAPLPEAFEETPGLADEVAAGTLPPVTQRLPETPLVVPDTAARSAGRPGGELVTLVARTKDTRLLSAFGYARLVGYNEDFELVPDILSRVEVEDGRVFTLHLRKGHRWSDGHPFTTDDFLYYWRNVALNAELSPSGPPPAMKPGGELPVVEVLDETRIRYSWSRPNPFFLPALAGTLPLYPFRPAHYVQRFHRDFANPDFLAAQVRAAGVYSWAALHNAMDNLYRFDNLELPVLEPWVLTTEAPSRRFVAKCNPYYHRVDSAGRQLPYLDRLVLAVTSEALIPAKTTTGESDLQGRGLNFGDITLLKRAEQRSDDFKVHLWKTVRGSQVALYPNLNANDPVWRALLRDVRFRRALSLAIHRRELNQVIYFGLGSEGNQSVLPASPLYDTRYRAAWADFDPDLANRLLDEIGLERRGRRGLRLLPDGRPLEVVVETAGENSEETDLLELIGDTWLQVGIKLFVKPLQREVLRNRIFSGDTVMSAWFGFENGVPGPDTSPEEFVPVRQYSFQWPKWGQHHQTDGRAGEPTDLPTARELLRLYQTWQTATDRAGRRAAWERILEINAEQVFTIGLVAGIPQPVVVRSRLRNVPSEAVFNWDPGAQFGIYRPDSFWLDGAGD